MGVGNNKVTTAEVLTSAFVVACMAAAASVTDDQGAVKFEVDKFCGKTKFKETCMKSMGAAKSNEPKDLMKAVLESTTAEIEAAIKSMAAYNKTASDVSTHRALEVCEDVLGRSMDDIQRSLERVSSFEIGKGDDALSDAKIWLNAADTYRTTCVDAFDEIKGNTKDEVEKVLAPTQELLTTALAMLAELKNFSGGTTMEPALSAAPTQMGEEQRQLMPADEDDEVSIQSRKLLAETPTPPAHDRSGEYRSIPEAVCHDIGTGCLH